MSTRTNVTKGREVVGWFNPDNARAWAEDTHFDGQNMVSVHTGDQWDHQMLYRTAGLRWVLNCYSARQGDPETYEFISENDAVKWFIRNNDTAEDIAEWTGHQVPDESGPEVVG